MFTLGVNLRITPEDRDYCRKKFSEELARLKALLQNREPELIQGCVQKLSALSVFFELENAEETFAKLAKGDSESIPSLLETVNYLERCFISALTKGSELQEETAP